MIAILTAISCHHAASEGCLEPDLALWCWPEDSAEECGTPEGKPSFRCGEYDVVTSGPNQSGVAHFFDHTTGEHVATGYWRDVIIDDEWCGGLEYWFGRRIECTTECTYDGSNPNVPLCD